MKVGDGSEWVRVRSGWVSVQVWLGPGTINRKREGR